jgi:hypothetical protein
MCHVSSQAVLTILLCCYSRRTLELPQVFVHDTFAILLVSPSLPSTCNQWLSLVALYSNYPTMHGLLGIILWVLINTICWIIDKTTKAYRAALAQSHERQLHPPPPSQASISTPQICRIDRLISIRK